MLRYPAVSSASEPTAVSVLKGAKSSCGGKKKENRKTETLGTDGSRTGTLRDVALPLRGTMSQNSALDAV